MSTGSKIEPEQQELDWLLASGVLGRSHNLTQLLKYICKKHFEGKSGEITEYAIAFEALERRADFDPRMDTIVRVTVHTLRKKLNEIYHGEGASHPVHILIPHGQYAPSFTHRSEAVSVEEAEEKGHELATEHEGSVPLWQSLLKRRILWAAVGLAGVAAVWIVAARVHRTNVLQAAARSGEPLKSVSSPVAQVHGKAIRALLGSDRKSYVDHSGDLWAPGNYCKGGESLKEPEQKIAGTEDPYIFLGGIRGSSHCIFPVEPGIYEVHLLFAEASDLQEATSRAIVFLNGSDGNIIDVVDDAGGTSTAITKVYRGVRAENDGAIHIDFVSEDSMLKAVELLPTPTEAMLPVRIVACSQAYTEPSGDRWLSDRYATGGRCGREKPDGAKGTGLYKTPRIGHFRYTIPVVPFEKYRVRLYFHEPWFGKQSGGTSDSSSRIFDVWCNGATLLQHFNILTAADSGPVVKTFDNIQATALGKIELDFVPVVNYALIDAIEIEPQSSQK